MAAHRPEESLGVVAVLVPEGNAEGLRVKHSWAPQWMSWLLGQQFRLYRLNGWARRAVRRGGTAFFSVVCSAPWRMRVTASGGGLRGGARIAGGGQRSRRRRWGLPGWRRLSWRWLV